MSADWPRCGRCAGIRTAGGTSCLAHTTPDDRAAVLKRFSESGDLDVRGVTISDTLLKEIFDAAPHDADGRRIFSAARFSEALIEARQANFRSAIFKGDAEFSGATVKSRALFLSAEFKRDAKFLKVTFRSGAEFRAATFARYAWFPHGDVRGLRTIPWNDIRGPGRFH